MYGRHYSRVMYKRSLLRRSLILLFYAGTLNKHMSNPRRRRLSSSPESRQMIES